MLLVYILAGILALLIVVFSVPFDIEVDYESSKPLTLKIAWLYGLIKFERKQRTDESVKSEHFKTVEGTRKNSKDWNSHIKNSRLKAVIQTKGLVPHIFELLQQLARTVEIKSMYGRFQLGTGDPADTGLLFGSLASLSSFLCTIPRTTIAIVPRFDRIVFEMLLQLRLHVVPIRIVWAVLRFVFSIESLRAINAMRKAA